MDLVFFVGSRARYGYLEHETLYELDLCLVSSVSSNRARNLIRARFHLQRSASFASSIYIRDRFIFNALGFLIELDFHISRSESPRNRFLIELGFHLPSSNQTVNNQTLSSSATLQTPKFLSLFSYSQLRKHLISQNIGKSLFLFTHSRTRHI